MAAGHRPVEAAGRLSVRRGMLTVMPAAARPPGPPATPAAPAARATAAPPGGLPPVTVVVGEEELLADRAVASVVALARGLDAEADIRDLPASSLEPGQLAELVSPSLFAQLRVVVLRDAEQLGKEVTAEVVGLIDAPADDVALVLVHRGGARNKALLDAASGAGARRVECQRITRPGDRIDFVRRELRAAGRAIGDDAARALIDAVGTDLRELAAASAQLASDTSGGIDVATVGRYYRGRAEASSFAVADRAMEGRLAPALEQLRWALAVGTAPVLITGALAQGVRAVAKVGGAPRGMRPAELARELGMPPWKVDRVRQQARGWTPDGVAAALQAVAEADALVKGGGTTPGYALERALIAIVAARR